jgi:hypothetical protein
MKKLLIVYFACIAFALDSCGSGGNTKQPATDSVSRASSSIDSAANNGIIPPSAAPENANNSSLADTTYKDTTKKK